MFKTLVLTDIIDREHELRIYIFAFDTNFSIRSIVILFHDIFIKRHCNEYIINVLIS